MASSVTPSIHDVAAALTAAGVPRSHRSIIRYCETAMLDAVKAHGPAGEQWFVSPASLPKAIGDLKQWEAQRARHSSPQPAMSDKQDSQKGSETEPVMARYVEQLEKRIEEKDDTIEFLQDELKDRRAQISGMKEIIDGQRQLLETINRNVAPVFGALAKLVAPKVEGEPIVATAVNEAEREVSSSPNNTVQH